MRSPSELLTPTRLKRSGLLTKVGGQAPAEQFAGAIFMTDNSDPDAKCVGVLSDVTQNWTLAVFVPHEGARITQWDHA